MSLVVELIVLCDRCGDALGCYTHSNGEYYASPCKACLAEAAKGAKADGYDEGYDAGKAAAE